ncbi:Hypothetical protein, putative [Bodo saltans]|uniref:Uncharacterized protein n=1 Tax=Bodo saltans TaxID=75058 RepID=A0A0S4IMM7_BODSA|nr:Hypothetical protein, putative [Bodo saltans]|eukprot:CUF49633.1 Hypothetical protein, putative [Bodo saltans]
MPGGAPLGVANDGSLPTAIPAKQQPQQRQSASASLLDDLLWATPSYQLNVVAAPPSNHAHFTNTAGHESSSSTMGNDAQQQDAPFDQQRRGISNARGLLNANTGQVGGNGSNNNNIGVAQIQTLSMLLDQCDKLVASILHGGPNNAPAPSVSPTPPHRSSVALSQQQQQQQLLEEILLRYEER